MGRKIIDRTGEENVNNFGSKMIIVGYRNAHDIDIYFTEYNWTAKNTRYDYFRNGNISCPYERSVYAVGYLGEGEYKCKENGRITRVYTTWHSMLNRCYDDKFYKRRPTYKDCRVSEKFLNFQNFGMWDEENYYKIEGERIALDKDILYKHNKIYSPETCIYVPERINTLFTKSDNYRGDSVIGTHCLKNGKYQVHCCLLNPKTGKSKNKYLGIYDTQQKAFEIYKYYKEKNIKEVADYYKDKIPQKLYNAMYGYEVEIDD